MLTPIIHIIRMVAIMKARSTVVTIKMITIMTSTTITVPQLLVSNLIMAKAAIRQRASIGGTQKKTRRPSAISR